MNHQGKRPEQVQDSSTFAGWCAVWFVVILAGRVLQIALGW